MNFKFISNAFEFMQISIFHFLKNRTNIKFASMAMISHFFTIFLAAGLQFNALSPDATGINTETICQDKSGSLWFGGMDGITRFDGTRFTVFRNDTRDEGSILDNRIYKLTCSADGRIWAAHISGLSMYDHATASFRNYRSPSGPATDILCLDDGTILTIADKRLWIFDVTEESFGQARLPEPLTCFPAHSLHEDNGEIFIGSTDGRIAVTSERFDVVWELPVEFGGCRINVIFRDTPEHIWVGTENNGLWSVPLDGSEPRQYKSSAREGSLSFDSVRAICTDADGRLWVGTKNGLNIFDGDRFEVYSHDYYDSRSITHNSIHEIFRDSQNSMWLGTYFGGVCYSTPQSSPFVSLFSKPGGNNLNGNVISDITEDTDGSLWIGTNSEGLNHMLPDGSFEHIRSIEGKNTEPVDIKCIRLSALSGKIYVGSDAARLSVLDRRSGKLTDLGADAPRDCYALEDNRRGGLFIGSTSGLFEYDEKNGGFSKILMVGDITNIKALKYDSGGILWIGKKFGVTALEWETGKILDLPSPLHEVRYAEDFLEDSAGRIWICTNGGLFRYDGPDGEVTAFTTGEGLPDNTIHGIEEDKEGKFWISTNKGLCLLDNDTGETRTFTIQDGLPGDRFTSYAHCFTSDGELYFGGLVGMVHFKPEAISQPCSPVAPVISEIELSGRTLRPKGNTVKLKPNEKDITVVFSAPDYISGQNGHFFYRMEGLNEDWHTAGMERKAVYHGLKHGRYSFLLEYSNSSGLKNEAPVRLDIVIQAHWWETLAARIAGICLILFSIILFVWWLISKKENEYKSEMERARNELLRDFSLEFVGIGADRSAPEKSSVADVFDKGDEYFMRKAMQVVRKNLDNPGFSVEEFASQMNVSKSGMHSRVKTLFGVSPLRFIKTVRFNEACRLILEKKHSFAEIAYMVGFASPSYFASAFHNFIGCTPTEYLAKNKNRPLQ